MKMKLLYTVLICFVLAGSFVSCGVNSDSGEEEFTLFPDHYIAGTIAPVESSRYSPYLIRFEDESTADFITSTATFSGEYTFRNDTLFFQTDDLEKVGLFVVQNEEIISSHYEVRFYREDGGYDPAPVQYEATGEVGEIPADNQLAGKSFTGDQYRFGTEGVFQEDVIYRFSATGYNYGTGIDEVDDQSLSYELINNIAFRYQEGSTKEFGALINGRLVVFRESGLFYWGTYNLQ